MRLKEFSSKRKGVTLAELSVVLAVVAIISTMVISFIVLLSGRVDSTTQKVNLNQEITVVEKAVESWVDSLVKDGATFSQDGKAVLDGNEYSFSFSDDSLTFDLPQNQTLSCPVKQIQQLFIETKTNGNKTLFICKAFFYSGNQPDSITFTVYPFVGTTLGG